MSASREKKLRQDAGPSPREAQAQKEAADYKRKAVTYTVIGVICAVLVAALLIWNSGVFQNMAPAASVGNASYSIGEVNYFYQQARYNANYVYYAYGMTQYIPDDADVQDEDSGKTWREYYLDLALDSLTELTALYDAAVKEGYKDADVSDSVRSQIDEAKSAAASNGYTYGNYLKARYGKQMSTGVFQSIVTRQALANKYYTDHYNALTCSDERIDSYYEENKDSLDTFEYSWLYFTPETVDSKDADGNELSEDKLNELKSAALDEAKAQAGEALIAIQGGKSPADAISQFSPSSSGDHTTNVGSSVSSLYSEDLFTMKDGEAHLVENGESGYYVVQLHGRTRLEDPTRDTRHVLLSAETTTDGDGHTEAPTDAAWASAREQAEKVLNEYNSGARTEDSFAELARQYSSDGSSSNGGLYEGVSPGQFVTEYDSWLFDPARKIGDVTLLQHPADGSESNYYGYHVVYYVGENDPVWKRTAITALKNADAEEWLNGLKSGYSGSLESGAQYVAQ